jgi:S1-C subfamily serine protease
MRLRQMANLTLAIILTSVVCGESLARDDVLRSMEKEFTRIVDDIGPAIVEVTARKGNLTRKSRPSAIREDVGTGIIIDREGYIVTTESVVGGADRIGVVLVDEKTFEARLLGVDPETDIALIKIDAGNLPIAPLGDSDKVRSGSWVITIGRSYSRSPTVSFGVVSGVESLPDRPAYYDAIKINAAVSPGNSGGGVIDMDGKVVGIITAALAEPRAIDFMLEVPELPELRVPELPELKVPELPPLYRHVYRDEWSRMEKLREEMIKAQQQLEDRLKNMEEMSRRGMREWENKDRPENTKQIEEISKQWAQVGKEHAKIIAEMVEINKQLAQEQKELARSASEMVVINRQLAQIHKGRSEIAKEMAEISRRVAQEQKELLKNTTVRVLPTGRFFGRREESFAIPIDFARTVIDDLMEDGEIDRGWLGIVIRPVRYWDMERLGLDAAEGVIVTEVIDNSPAAKAGIRKGDVIINLGHEKIRTPTSFIRMVATTKPHAKVSLTVISDKQKRSLDVEIGKRPK